MALKKVTKLSVKYEPKSCTVEKDAKKRGANNQPLKKTGKTCEAVRAGIRILKMKKLFVILVAFMAVTAGVFAQSQVAISPVKLNVLYLGVDNPLNIAVPGVPAEKISVTINQGTINKVSGIEYIARPSNTEVATIDVFAEMDGENRKVGSMEFRVFMVPSPTPKVAGQNGGVIDRNALASQQGVTADLGDFLFDKIFEVTQFTIGISTPQGDLSARSNSSEFTTAQKEIISSLDSGSRIFFSDIRARSTTGVRVLRDMVFTID
jgi:gliding motility-associated protein GldM